MNLDTAPSLVTDEETECPICETDDPYVVFESDSICENCQYIRGTYDQTEESEWRQWLTHRREKYSGWYGEERIKMAGGLASNYTFEEDF